MPTTSVTVVDSASPSTGNYVGLQWSCSVRGKKKQMLTRAKRPAGMHRQARPKLLVLSGGLNNRFSDMSRRNDYVGGKHPEGKDVVKSCVCWTCPVNNCGMSDPEVEFQYDLT